MPEMDGLEATRLIRRLEADQQISSGIPIIALTAYAMKEDRLACLDAGMNDHLAKPVNPKAVFSTIERWLLPGRPSAESVAAGDADVTGMLTVVTGTVVTGKDTERAVFEQSGLLDRLMGDEAMLKEILRLFVQEMPVYIKKLKTVVRQGDLTAIFSQAHKMKGTAANIGAVSLQQLFFELEEACNQGETVERMNQLLSRIEAVYSKTDLEIRAFIDGVRLFD
jgi:two-component system, sensor histidine kinase and response regulator